ncbi:MAG: DNA gyrase inhibitor YacG [Planctomycetes bacterium]|nr:DNA gyrase inhibitor YacG [Planctomycetota bacterium]
MNGNSNGDRLRGLEDREGKPAGGALQLRCPTCSKLTRLETNKYFPFCSKRCRGSDFFDWVEGRHSIAGEPDSGKEDEWDMSGTDPESSF